jgi:hypothetical protein
MALLLPVLLTVLFAGCSGECGPAERQEVELTVTPADLDGAVFDPDGDLSAKTCVDLCRELFCGTIEEVHGCEVTQAPGGAEAPSDGTIACDVTAVPCCE